MKPINNYESIQKITEPEKLPVGGYIIDIFGAKEITYSWGSVLEFKFDIAEGEYKNFYTNQYSSSQTEDKKYKGVFRLNVPKGDGSEMDEWTARKFKTNLSAIEDSNPNFHWDWDETKLAGRKVGAVFFEKEWEMDGRAGFYVTIHSLRAIEDIKNGNFKVPQPKLLKKKSSEPDHAMEEPEMDDMPF
ncbi:MAG: hypothetical protein HFE78_07405 [Clostridiales bacterium]|nr:hypothetical protein [Clostridiales bacterium]